MVADFGKVGGGVDLSEGQKRHVFGVLTLGIYILITGVAQWKARTVFLLWPV